MTEPDVLAVSRFMQRSLVPRNAPEVPGYDVGIRTVTPPGGAGCSAWADVPLPDGRHALCVLNVQGDGLPPAHHAFVASLLLKERAGGADGVDALLSAVNDGLVENAPADHDPVVECSMVVPDGSRVEWACAGRAPAAVIRRDGGSDELPSGGPPLGMMKGFGYGSRIVELEPGDCLLVLSRASSGLFLGAADLAASLDDRSATEVVGTLARGIEKAGRDGGHETTILFARRG